MKSRVSTSPSSNRVDGDLIMRRVLEGIGSDPELFRILFIAAKMGEVTPLLCKKYIGKPQENLEGTEYEQYRLILTRLASYGWFTSDVFGRRFTPTRKLKNLIYAATESCREKPPTQFTKKPADNKQAKLVEVALGSGKPSPLREVGLLRL
jgi:hypothetical protein